MGERPSLGGHPRGAGFVASRFTDPYDQCVETWTFGDIYWAIVIWQCTREV